MGGCPCFKKHLALNNANDKTLLLHFRGIFKSQKPLKFTKISCLLCQKLWYNGSLW
ncbi:hypothetical protein [Moraxella lacunata]|uniref:hypothetical protein n=1 Tax=Moraxella lacunata TaxID=477 RepID=UPI000AC6906A